MVLLLEIALFQKLDTGSQVAQDCQVRPKYLASGTHGWDEDLPVTRGVLNRAELLLGQHPIQSSLEMDLRIF